MTNSEIESIFLQIEGLSSSEIQNRVNQELSKSPSADGELGSLFGNAVFTSFSLGKTNKTEYNKKNLEDVCKKSWELNRTKIHSIILNNPKTSKSIMDIVMLLAPAIAQQYTGFSGMAIVGTLTILCKQNLGL